MFISYTYSICVSKNAIQFGCKSDFEYEIIDTDFIEAVIETEFQHQPGILSKLIEVYERHNLPVIPNFLRCLLFIHKEWGYKMSEIIDWNKQQNPRWHKYEQDIEKLLLLL